MTIAVEALDPVFVKALDPVLGKPFHLGLATGIEQTTCAACLTQSEDLKQWVARELHDRVAPVLTTMVVQIENFKSDHATSADAVMHQLASLQDSTREAMAGLRRLLQDLRGVPAAEEDFVEAVRQGAIRPYEERSGVTVRFSVSRGWPCQLSAYAAHHLFGIVQEALNNVLFHSGAATVSIALRLTSDGTAGLVIRDDGRGVGRQDRRTAGMGLLGMRERAALIGGRLEIRRRVPRGTSVRAIFPIGNLL
jgi:two-component system sensor histidine kinase UhpB